jgi:hypothetical protein
MDAQADPGKQNGTSLELTICVSPHGFLAAVESFKPFKQVQLAIEIGISTMPARKETALAKVLLLVAEAV